tara:strand:- start:125 stop:490 length:366 start_codon:yes stop_codon:yes gene_type:complete
MNNILNSSSYEEYLKDQLSILSPNFTVKTYKRANEDEWGGFIKGKDLRIQIHFKKKSLFEFLVETSFWRQRNTNKEDRIYMRRWANPKIQMIKNAQIKKKPKSSNNVVSKTQDAFEKMKKK